MINEEIGNSALTSLKKSDCSIVTVLSGEPKPDLSITGDNLEIESRNSTEHDKKDSIMSKFLQRLSKPDLHSKPKKVKTDKSKHKQPPHSNQSQELPNDKTIGVAENGINNSSRSKNFRKIFKKFRKVKDDKLSDSSEGLASRPLRSGNVNVTAPVACAGSCNDVNIDQICRVEFEPYNSPSVDCILDYQARQFLKDRESLSSTSEDLRDHEQTMNASNSQIVSIFPEDIMTIKKSDSEAYESTADKDTGNIKTVVINPEENKNMNKICEEADVEYRTKKSEETDIMLRKSSRPTEIQLRRSRVTSQSSVARNSLIMVAVAHNSPRVVKCVGNQATSPICNQDSPSYVDKKLDFDEDRKLIEEEKSEKTINEKNGNDFLKIVNQYEVEINRKIDIVQQYMKTFIDEMSDDVIGQLSTTVGLAKLLLSEKFVQFRGLCHQNLNETAENGFKTLCCDLEGYLMTLEIQIADLEKNFQLVEKIRDNKWQMVIETGPKLANGVKKKKPKAAGTARPTVADNQRTLEAKRRIAEYKKMCALKSQESTNLLFVE